MFDDFTTPHNAADVLKALSKPKSKYVIDDNPRASFISELRSHGFEQLPALPTVGKLERIQAPNDKPKQKSGWYIYNEIPDDFHKGAYIGIGVFGNWKGSPERVVWTSKHRESMSPVESARFEEQLRTEKLIRDEAMALVRSEAAQKAAQIWAGATAAPLGHPYLVRKQIKPSGGIRVSRGKIIVPVMEEEKLTSLQFIDTDGGKRFLSGGKVKGCYFKISGTDDTIYVAEGYATAATVHEITECSVYTAFNAGNLMEVTSVVRVLHPDAKIIIAGDDDHKTEGNPGRTKANAAGERHGCKVIFPEVSGDDTDFNDMARSKDVESVRVAIAKTQEVPFDGEPLDLLAKFEPKTFPIEILPPVLRDFVREQSELIGSDPAILAVSSIVVCASAINDNLKVQPKQYDPTYTESARLWGAIIGAPSTRKTPAISKAMGPVKVAQGQWAREDAPLLEKHEIDLKLHKKLESNYISERVKSPDKNSTAPKKPEKPSRRRSYVEDITVEALSDVMVDNDRGILLYADELSGFFGSFGAYSPGKADKDRGHYLELWNGGPRQIDRVLNGSKFIPNWSGCILGGIQPGPMQKIASKVEDDGLLQRFLPVICRDAKMETDRRPNMDAIDGYKVLVHRIYEYKPHDKPLKLDAGAQEIRREFLKFATQSGVLGALSSKLGAHLGKYGGIYERMLLTFHVVEALGTGDIVPDSISEQTAAVVSDLMRKFFFSHATAFYLDILGDTPDYTAARAVAGYILASEISEITNRVIQGNVRQMRALNQRDRQRVMEILTMSSWVTPIDSYKPNGPTKWSVNPRVHECFKDRARQERKDRNTKKDAIATTMRELNTDRGSEPK